MYCYKCGTELIDGATFCIKCGTRQPIQTQANSSTKSVSKEEMINLLVKQCPKISSAVRLYFIYFGLTHNCLCTEQRHYSFNLNESFEVDEGYARFHLVGHDNIEYEYVCDTETELIIARENGIVNNVDIRPLRKLFINVYPKQENAIIEAYKDDFDKLMSDMAMFGKKIITKDIRDYLYGIVGYGVKTNTGIQYRHYAYIPSVGRFDKQLDNEQVISLDMIVADYGNPGRRCPSFVRLYVGGYYVRDDILIVGAEAIDYNIEFDWKLLNDNLKKDGYTFFWDLAPKSILGDIEMDIDRQLSEIKKQEEDSDQNYRKGMPVWDSTPNGVCDCAVGECDCDGSIWN